MDYDSNFGIYVGKDICLYLKDGTEIQGHCIGYAPWYDNDPEIASINLRGKCNFEIDATDIDHIDMID